MIELSNCLWIPERQFSEDMAQSLTVRSWSLDGTFQDVAGYRTDRAGYIGLPRVRGLKLISSDYEDRMSRGTAVKFRKKVSLRDYQIPFVEAMLDAAESRGDFVAEAATGKGKTVCGLSVAQRLACTTVVLVDQENLMEQWVERCVEHLGMRPEEVGIVRGPRCEYRGRAIVIAMVQTLVRRAMPDDFYDYFGCAIYDECHTAGAPTFSRALMMFSAHVRFGLSATPDREDSLQRLIEWNLGPVGARLTSELARSCVYIRESTGVYSFRVNHSKMTGGFINELVDDGERNLLIVQSVKWLYESGRDVLVMSDRIEHLCSLMAMSSALGIPDHDLGLYAKSKTAFRYEKDPRPARRPDFLLKGAEYSPVRLSLLQKTVPKPDREAAKNKARVLFATYGVMAKGVDVPRLSAGIDATPRSEATQVLGRVLRAVSGKLRPIWVTVADVNSFRSLYQLSNRLADYEASNAEVFLWDPTKGRKRLDVKAYRRELAARISLLRQSQITTSLDGNATILTPTTPSGSGNFLVRRTGRISR